MFYEKDLQFENEIVFHYILCTMSDVEIIMHNATIAANCHCKIVFGVDFYLHKAIFTLLQRCPVKCTHYIVLQ